MAVIAFLRRTLAAPGDTDHVAQRLQSYGALIVMLAPPIGWAVPATLVIMGCGL